MSSRRSLSLPITLAVVMIVLLVVLIVGWVLLAVFAALDADKGTAGWYWGALSVGTTFIVLILVGVVLYLILSIKAINLTRRQSNFIDSVTHELKSPIASMKLYLQTLARREVSHQEQVDFHRFMLEDLERLDLVISRLLDAQRIESKRTDGELEDVAISDLLEECAGVVCWRYRVPPSTVKLDVESCVIRTRRLDLEIICRNLIENAVKYAGTGPRVEVRFASQAEESCTIQISDNGRGIPPKLRRKIFGRFVRLGNELEREKPGTGLGLYIVRTLVKRLGGQIRVRSRKVGPGTTFEVHLPIGPQSPEKPDAGNTPDSLDTMGVT